MPDVAHLSLEKLGPYLPLDLSHGSEVTAPLAPDPCYRNECPRAEKEDTQMLTNLSSKAVTDGRGAPAASGKTHFTGWLGLHLQGKNSMMYNYIVLRCSSSSQIL